MQHDDGRAQSTGTTQLWTGPVLDAIANARAGADGPQHAGFDARTEPACRFADDAREAGRPQEEGGQESREEESRQESCQEKGGQEGREEEGRQESCQEEGDPESREEEGRQEVRAEVGGPKEDGGEAAAIVLRAVFFDLGGVILRTEFEAPRERLAERFGLTYDELSRRVFDGESGRQATIGAITAKAHWESVLRILRAPPNERERIQREFFAGDVVDRELLDFIRKLRSRYRVGLISNAWDDLREFIARERFDDAFDAMIISAEVKAAKPDARIFQAALDKLGVAPGEAVFVDDVAENVAGCQAVGMHGVLFRSPEQMRKELDRLLND